MPHLSEFLKAQFCAESSSNDKQASVFDVKENSASNWR